MRKLLYIMAGVIMVIGLNSCEKKGGIPASDMGLGSEGVKGAPVTVITDSYPLTQIGEVAPYLIPAEKDRGGNRTCDDAKDAFAVIFGRPLDNVEDCGQKVDIDDDYVGFVGDFPFEVEILSDGTMRFNTGGPECKVFAVIVKGSNQANVYYYPDGAVVDAGLTPPPFDPEADEMRFPWISNITFCCTCDEPDEPGDKFIAIKVAYVGGGFALSAADAIEGSNPWSGAWCYNFGVNPYHDVTPIGLVNQEGEPRGEAVVNGEGDVTVTLTDVEKEIANVYIYVGDMPAASGDCPTYTVWMTFPGDGDNSVNITWP